MSIRILVLALVLASFGCNTTEPPPPPPPPPPEPNSTIALAVEDFGVTDSWLRLSIPDTITERSFTLLRDSQIVLSGGLLAPDTVVRDFGLVPGRTYLYRAYRVADSAVVDSSSVFPVVTMDTTSHLYSWTIDTLGAATSSLRDVAVISDDDIWVVGNIDLNDSTGVQYNVARWDGAKWTILRVMFPICDVNGNELGVLLPSAIRFSPLGKMISGSWIPLAWFIGTDLRIVEYAFLHLASLKAAFKSFGGHRVAISLPLEESDRLFITTGFPGSQWRAVRRLTCWMYGGVLTGARCGHVGMSLHTAKAFS